MTPQEARGATGQISALDTVSCVSESQDAPQGQEMMILRVTVPLPPTLNHLYPTVRGRRRLSEVGRQYHDDAGWCIKEAAMRLPWRTRPGQRYRMTMVLHFADMRSDISNRIKALEDTVADVLGFNDKAVDILEVRRGSIDKANPHVELTIGVLAEAGEGNNG